jgi:hypothetical protein
MSKYTDSERAAILELARANLAEPPISGGAQGFTPGPLASPESQSELWKKRADERDADRERHRLESEVTAIERRVEQQLRSLLTEGFKTIVAGMIEAEHGYIVDELLPSVMAEFMDAMADELKVEIEKIRSDVAALKQKVGISEVTDIPQLPLRYCRPN